MSEQEYKPEQVEPFVWEVPKTGKMRVPARVYADARLIDPIVNDGALKQAVNVTQLPGIVGASLAMPDAHWGYGFPIGGVAATDPRKQGVISPGGIGFDINCGVRLVRTDLSGDEVKARSDELVNKLYDEVPCGVGSSKAIRNLSRGDMDRVFEVGAGWAVENGFGREDDLIRTEENGALDGASPDPISNRAYERGQPQMGTLGSGNHFLEVDVVDEVFDERVAEAFGIEKGLAAVQIHCGSRGFGHEVCSGFLKVMQKATRKYDIDLPDRQLACAPLDSPEGKDYLAAMASAANYAWCNRQVILSLVAKAFGRVFDTDRDGMGFQQVYDVCHNIAKMETHRFNGKERKLCVHRKGATRAFPAEHPDVPGPYRHVGQPVLIPGDMGTCSFLLVGAPGAMEKTWGSTCHGAGRTMSRKEATKKAGGRKLEKELADRGVTVRSAGRKTIAEEMPYAYKNSESVVNVMHEAGITRKVARLKPVAVVKG